MEFCEKCGKPLKVMKNDMDIIVANCSFCGTKKLMAYSGLGYNESPVKKEKTGDGVLSDKQEGHGFPHLCKKCGHEFADVLDLGAQYSDESNIYLFKCKNCKYIERQSDGTGN